MKDKNLPRLDWSTATITDVTRDKDGLVRKVMVRPDSRHDKSTTQALRERAIHDLVLLKAITMRDHPERDIMDAPNTPEEATILKFSSPLYDHELFTTTPEERPSLQISSSHFRASHVQQPISNKLTDPFSKLDSEFLQTTADALLAKIEYLRTENRVQPASEAESSGISDSLSYPMAIPFLTSTNVFLSKIAKIPMMKRELQLDPIVPMPNGNDPYTSIPTKKVFELGRIWTRNLNITDLPYTLPPIPTQIHSEKKVHWDDEPTVLLIEPNGRMTPTSHLTIQEKKG